MASALLVTGLQSSFCLDSAVPAGAALPWQLSREEVSTMTPYENHKTLAHKMTRYSPNGIDIVEECEECEARFIHNPSIGYPVTLEHVRRKETNER
jgi:hypothetical protein